MYPMSKRSLLIRIALLPVYVALWFFGGIIALISYIAEKAWNFMDRLMDKFMAWVTKVAPLDSDKKV